ncbi:hypothetical protein Tco_0947187 [Tanacetum coccineum]
MRSRILESKVEPSVAKFLCVCVLSEVYAKGEAVAICEGIRKGEAISICEENDISMLQSVKESVKDWLGKCFAMKDLGDAAYILGIKIYRDMSKRLIGLSQHTLVRIYVLKLMKSRVPYASAIGSIMYAMTCTRSDVSFSLSMVIRHQQNTGEGHWTAVKNILKYLRITKDMFLVYGGEEELRVTGYCYASWQTDI